MPVLQQGIAVVYSNVI